ncbi:cysteinyl-tRNA synthetase [Geotalea daltonii FRC-32]|uniref:Cysteine--tRNA ligase n=1 Tax=Geotalea daltonii (strain DSM 22248 / JCM 15807 / FRC-32) TaxID=316067 RepID=SYC_GEODF|nr:cysteine--tRNA ligase [Geotalea daltonii]B9LZV4.1 RecName: Full=Cysteine--tRNA ligase; AltName: Full=Cysteinyl-tRNA synthetase; Short=CysRS [Geotalea daltonii FRC-32]ACM18918.1 cysteinyl-tRNA synthetase [Geotalea daltonii FRC-32]
MGLRVYNTLSGNKEEFVPVEPGKVKMYVCGVTVYDHCHIGHARANVVFDVIYRYFCHLGLDVTYVRNYTDIDDKIINRANREGVTYDLISERFIKEFDRDMERLGLKLPTCQPKATEHIDEIISLVQTLIDKDFAYQAGGDVNFCVEKFDSYLKLSGRTLEDMQAGARIEVDERKRHPMDFALWKEAKPGEPFWESPWGKGRPGWHIECSAMSMKYLGTTFDIHGGGKDLIFPHHENEIAQSEAATGKPFVNYWLHNGFVNINSEKMSKSLGNFFTIKEVLDRYDNEVLRFFLLSAHYRSPIDFSDQNLTEAEAGLERIYKALAAVEETLAAGNGCTGAPVDASSLNEAEGELFDKTTSISARFGEAMDDDFNTALAMAHVFDLVRCVNRVLSETAGASDNICSLCTLIKAEVAKIAGVLGIFSSKPASFLERLKSRKAGNLDIAVDEIERLIAERTAARKAKDFKRSDEIRDQLAAKNIVLLDSQQGTTWSVK